MMDKIKAEADAIPCGKDEKIKALEALLKLAIKERDEALAAYEHVCNVALQCTAIVESADGCLGADLIEACNIGLHKPAMAKLLAALKAEWQAEVVESFLHGLSSSDTINIHNRLPEARVEWFRKRAKEAGDE